MDKNILKKFAIESRKDLMKKVSNKMETFYLDENFDKFQNGDIITLSYGDKKFNLTSEEYQNRNKLLKRIKEIGKDAVIEEVAYTWFNRIIAIRYMEIHDFLPLTKDNQSLGIRVLSSKDNTPDPEIMKFANLADPDLDIDFKKEKYVEIKDDNKRFEYILLLVCKKLGKVIPSVFDGVTEYIDLLIPDNMLNDTGFISKLIKEVPEDNFDNVEVIGWLYQYYISEKKDDVFKKLKDNIKISKDNIPAATQLFTPDWIVKYMVENSLGRYWIEHNGNNESLINNWKYFIKDNLDINNKKINPENISFIDPCSGSGHILIYAFEVLYQIYECIGYNKDDIPELILKNNLYGLDIDDRAGQLSVLSVLLKAREYDKNIFNKDIVKNLNIMSIQESNSIDRTLLNYSKTEEEQKEEDYLLEKFKDAKEIGSLLIVENKDYTDLINTINKDNGLFTNTAKEKILPLIKEANILSKKYDIVVTNPPYMGNKGLNTYVRYYLEKNYNHFKYDTYSAFIKKCFKLSNIDGMVAIMSPNTWMFISTYENMRKKLLDKQLISLLHLSPNAFKDAAVVITTFIYRNSKNTNKSLIYNLQSCNEEDLINNFKEIIIRKKNINLVDTKKFLSIPNYTFSYWISDNFLKNISENDSIKGQIISDGQTKTGDNDKYIRFLWEVSFNKIGKNQKWNIHAKGGEFRKWFGNLDSIIDWSIKARNFYKEDKVARITPEYLWFKKGITWTLLSGNKNSYRVLPDTCTFNCVGPAIFCKNNLLYNYILGLLNSKVGLTYVNAFNPTLSLTIGNISSIPLIINKNYKDKIDDLVDECILISKQDWDSFETSWDFKKHPLIEYKTGAGYNKDISKWNYKIEDAFNNWKENADICFNQLKSNEEELNRIFIDIYGLQDELTPDEDDKDVTIRRADRLRDIKSFISYAVGCMFGRYSLDEEGLIYAGGEFDKDRYKTFKADEDNIIPITDEPYFSDDIVERFKEFLRVSFGKGTLNENMDFIAETLGKKGTETSEDTIRRYFVNDFFNDHCKTYQKRPIYWLFDSGKKNGFKCLIYMHRYNENLVPKIRLDYLHRTQITYEKLLSDVNYRLTTDLSLQDKKAAIKRQAELNAKIQEINEYDEKINHIANQKIKIDLDDGVKVNYAKFQDVLAKIK